MRKDEEKSEKQSRAFMAGKSAAKSGKLLSQALIESGFYKSKKVEKDDFVRGYCDGVAK